MSALRTWTDQNLGTRDIAGVVSALLEGIRRGELHASPKEVAFLSSIEGLLKTTS